MSKQLLDSLEIASINPGGGIGDILLYSDKTLLASFSPIDEQSIASVKTCGEDEYNILINRAKVAAEEWKTWPAPKRGEIIRQIGDALRVKKEALGMLISLEMGKSKQEGLGEVQEMIDMADFSVGQSRMLYGNTMQSERSHHRMYEQWHPHGIIGVISAFNFPVAVWAWNAFLAAICGNVTLWKPSSKTPLCAVAVHRICQKVLAENKAPAIFGYFIPENRVVGELLIKDKQVSLISFTGSTRAGRHVNKMVAERFGKTILELGGNNAIIIDETADLKLAIPAVVFGAVGTAGQRCTSTRRVFIHTSIYNNVLEKLKQAYEQITIGDPLDTKKLMGPLIDHDAVLVYQKACDNITKQGGDIIVGGKVLDQKGYYVEPTIVTGLSNNSAIVQQETFAPILYVMKYSNLKEAIALQNAVPQGLSSALFTQSLKASEFYLSNQGSDCGIANINIGTSGAEIGGAFGGEKETGGGRESGSDAWKGYMRRQTNTINWGNDLPLAQGVKFDYL
jgi:aldehyde dehydrogenase (NAD+)